MHYAILIYGVDGAFDQLSSDKQAEVLQGHRDFQAKLEARGAYGTARLMPTSHAVTMKPAQDPSEPPLVIDGPFAETKERFLGLYIADFTSLDEAIELTKTIATPYVSLELRPIAWSGGRLSDL